jgi:hypothetical protein
MELIDLPKQTKDPALRNKIKLQQKNKKKSNTMERY